MSDYLSVQYQTTDNLWIRSLGYEDNPALAQWGPGYRNYCILHYVVKGSGYYNGTKVCAGQGFYIHSSSLHEYHSDRNDPWNYYWIIFSEEMANKYVLPIFRPNETNIFSVSHPGRLVKMYTALWGKKKGLSHVEALGFFFQLLSLQEAKEQEHSSAPALHVQKAKLYMEDNFNKKISIGDIADSILIDERYLYNLFIRYEQQSPKEYLLYLRFSHACNLLENTTLPIGEIARSCGFDDVCSFSKFFTGRAGSSPSKYRNRFISPCN